MSKTVYALIGVFVAVLIIATVAVPVIDNAQDGESTKYNNSSSNHYLMLSDVEDAFTISFAASDSSVVIDGETFVRKASSNYLLLSDVASVTFNSTTSGGISIASSAGSNTYNTEAITISLNNNVLSIKVGNESVVSGAVKWVAIPSSEGSHIIVEGTTERYVNGVNDIIAGSYNSTMGYVWCHLGELPVGISMVVNNLTKIDGYTDLYTCTGVTLSDEGDNSMTPFFWLVPSEVSAHTAANNSHIALLGATLILLFIVPVMMVVRMISGRRD